MSSDRQTVVRAGSENGFMEDVRLIFRAGLSDGDYRGQNEAKPF
jgi:hypothetical protein